MKSCVLLACVRPHARGGASAFSTSSVREEGFVIPPSIVAVSMFCPLKFLPNMKTELAQVPPETELIPSNFCMTFNFQRARYTPKV